MCRTDLGPCATAGCERRVTCRDADGHCQEHDPTAFATEDERPRTVPEILALVARAAERDHDTVRPGWRAAIDPKIAGSWPQEAKDELHRVAGARRTCVEGATCDECPICSKLPARMLPESCCAEPA